MKKPEKNKQKRLAKIKRGTKRLNRFKASREIVAKKRKEAKIVKALKQKRMNEMLDKIMQSRFNQ